MGRNAWFLPVLLCCGFLVELCRSQGFTVIGPKTIRPNRNYTVICSNSQSRNIQVEVLLQGQDSATLQQLDKFTVVRSNLRQRTFHVGDIPDGDYSLQVRSLETDVAVDWDVDLQYNEKTMSIFIQTDKPVYKPGDILRFRVMVIDADTRPVTSIKTISVGLRDSDNNSIRQWPFARLTTGIFQSEVQLASSPNLGKWTINVTVGSRTAEKHIELREYVLPKFFVKVYPSEILLIEKKMIILTVESLYTFNMEVTGTAKVDLYLEEDSRRPEFTKTVAVAGRATVEFNLAEELELELELNYKNVFVQVNMMEAFSNRTVNVTQTIPVFQYPYTISFTKSMRHFWAGEHYKLDMHIKDPNGVAPSEGLNAVVTIKYEGGDLQPVELDPKPLDENGLVKLTLNPPSKANTLIISVQFEGVQYENVETIYAAQSKSNQYLRISLKPGSRVRVGYDTDFKISCTERMQHFSYIVISRGNIVDSGFNKVPNAKEYTLKLRKLRPEMAPAARIVVFFAKKGYLIFDSLVLSFETFYNDFKYSLDEDNYIPGQSMYIDINAAKDSYVAFQAIDQSALLLGRDGHDLTKLDVLEDLNKYGIQNPDEFDPFHTMGLFLRSNTEVDIPIARGQFGRFGSFRDRRDYSPAKPRTRIDFPEAWLWESITMDGRRTAKQVSYTVPDTITSWYVTGYALSPTLGLGIMSQPASFVVKKDFYMVANLPYSIKRGEVTLIQVTIFNFIGNTLTTHVTLYNKNDEVEFVEQSSNDTTQRTKGIITPTNHGKAISFMIKAKKLGEIAIKLEARNQLKADALEHMLRVTPESRKYEKNEARFIDLDQPGKKNFHLKIDIPRNADEGSAKIKFTLDPDTFGTTVLYLDNLIRKPSGCGEQNMVHFVPNIVILNYLKESGKIAEHARTKAIDYMESGYQNQLKYKRHDGSFSVWGTSDTRGSTFLTAFVAAAFKIADKHMTIDKNVVREAFRWLATKQQSNGRFSEVGRVIHTDLQGGLSSTSFALTAFVAIAFLENEDIAAEHRSVVQKAVTYLTNNFYTMTDVYDLSMATYALSLQNHPKKGDFLDKLLESSIFTTNDTYRYWNRRPVNIEVAGYALLSYVAQGKLMDALPIVRWLNSQRYATGGYAGTQETFVGLKALGKFAAKTSSQRNEYRVTVRHKPNKMYNFDVDRAKSSLSVMAHDLPDTVREVDVQIDGIGHGMFQVGYQYYQNIQFTKESFKLDVEMLKTTTENIQHLSICVKYIPKEAYQRSNMALVEVFLPSGLVVDPDAVEDLSPEREIRKTEIRFSSTSVAVYYDSLGTSTNCFKVTAYRRFKVALHRPAYVVVYDYYNQDRFAIKTYEGKVMQLCDICEDEDCVTLSCG